MKAFNIPVCYTPVENSAAELTSAPDMQVALALAARHDVEAMAAG